MQKKIYRCVYLSICYKNDRWWTLIIWYWNRDIMGELSPYHNWRQKLSWHWLCGLNTPINTEKLLKIKLITLCKWGVQHPKIDYRRVSTKAFTLYYAFGAFMKQLTIAWYNRKAMIHNYLWYSEFVFSSFLRGQVYLQFPFVIYSYWEHFLLISGWFEMILWVNVFELYGLS